MIKSILNSKTTNLRFINLFKHLTIEELEKYSVNFQLVELKEGETLFRPGQKLKGIYFIERGVLKQYRIGSKNKEQIYQLLSFNDMLGFDSALNQTPATEFTTCMEKARLIFVPIQIVTKLFAESVQVRQLLLQQGCRELGAAQNTIINFSQKSNRQRIIDLLLDLRERFNLDQDNMINVSIKRMEIAGHIGANEENTIRILSDLRKNRLIHTKGRKIGILKLQRFGEAYR
ncbi:Crp/Fnr family transcriptional regulator [Draconibacterium sp. IB214405]|uniref:Crp/Fnr family transcriptional regulator n=1 Tax=Draconibacterium sp. IB214405 TaxID=3097352 RepID=UPI002A0E3815|nr:Crp/Fnr family transcriptional regulator [Draconibacterium sp. IB214405]MDX8340680.1 Crp/Fnr family transcriptional regulator [Draconibacterium sp. IB214405]